MKKILALAAVAALTAGVSAYAANPFSDVTADDSAEDICEKLVAVMPELTYAGITGEMTWTADGEPQKPAKAMIIHNGVAELFSAGE